MKKATPQKANPHLSHAEVVVRLKRAAGHLDSVIAMIGAGRGCVELAQQLHAIEKALGNAKKILIHDHIDHCLELQADASALSAKSAIKEFKELSKYL
jgi:uncharacterized protein